MVDRNDRGHYSAGETAPVIRYTAPPGISTEVEMRVQPNASCTLRRDDGVESQENLKLYADPNGVIRFHVRPSAESDRVLKLVIECEVEGGIVRYPLELRSSTRSISDAPMPPSRRRWTRQEGAYVRPALSENDLLRLPDEDLLERGYPIRPNPEDAPEAFNSWRRAVSAPAAFIEPQLVSRPDITHGLVSIVHGPASSNNWSGFELRGAGPYDWVSGSWIVPPVSGELNTTTYSAFWIGLDGDGTSDLVQDGTEQDNVNIDFGFVQLTFSTFYAWTEFLPQQPTEQQITNFPINPGDSIFSEVWVGNAGSSPTLSGAFGVFFFENTTTSQYTYIYTPVGSTVVGGSEAVWIMERPTVSGNFPDLADYGSATMSHAYARRANSPKNYVAYQGDTNLQITMVNGSDTLSTVSPVDAFSMSFSWQAFH